MASKLEVLSLFGFRKDPFYGVDLESADAIRVRTILGMAVPARAQVSVVGDRGAGKSRAVGAALRNSQAQVVRVLTPDKARISAGDIQEAMISDLSTEAPKRAKEVKARQLRRILGEASRKSPVVVVIEEAHRLDGWTLRSIKNLRELDWMGETQLFAVILIGHSDPSQRTGLSEVRLRTETVYLHGLTQAEILKYVKSTVGQIFEEEAVAKIAGLSEAKNYLDLQDFLIRCMSHALAAGREKVGVDDVAELITTIVRDEGLPVPRSSEKSGQALRNVLDRRAGKGPLRGVTGSELQVTG